MPSSRAIWFIVEKTTPLPTRREDLDPATTVVAVVNLSEAESYRRVLTTQIGFVAMPAMAAAQSCTYGFSCPPLNRSAMIYFPFPYVKKFIDRAGTTSTRVA